MTIQRAWQMVRPYGRWAYYSIFPERRPVYFEAAWGYPHGEIEAAAPRMAEQDGAGSVFLFFPLVDWHVRTQRPQHLASALAAMGHACIYVNPHLGLEYKRPALLEPRARLAELGPRVWELHVHLPAEHAIDSRMLAEEEADTVADAVESVLDRFAAGRATQIVSLPAWMPVVARLRARRGFPIVYDCHDHLAGFDRLSSEILAAEPALIEQADRVLFSSQPLADGVLGRMPEARGKSTIVRNGCWPDFFLPHDGARRKGRPTIGYVGSLEYWFDTAMVARAAEVHPTFDFALAGRVEDARIHRLSRFPNVRLMGELPYASVPEFLRACDVGVIPFSRIPLTHTTNPIKLYEYFAAGLPVVSSRMPEVEAYGGLAHIADGPDEFAACVARAAGEDDAAARERRLAVARAETWPARASAIRRIAEGLAQWAEAPADGLASRPAG